MPTYQYNCTECGVQVEAVQKFSDEPLSVCASCGGRLRKVFSPVGIVFKGSGFYRTDSRNGSSSATATKANETGSDSADSVSKADKADKPEKKSSETVKSASTTGASASSASEKVA